MYSKPFRALFLAMIHYKRNDYGFNPRSKNDNIILTQLLKI